MSVTRLIITFKKVDGRIYLSKLLIHKWTSQHSVPSNEIQHTYVNATSGTKKPLALKLLQRQPGIALIIKLRTTITLIIPKIKNLLIQRLDCRIINSKNKSVPFSGPPFLRHTLRHQNSPTRLIFETSFLKITLPLLTSQLINILKKTSMVVYFRFVPCQEMILIAVTFKLNREIKIRHGQ